MRRQFRYRKSRYNPGQWKLLRDTTTPFICIAGGVGSGKSRGLAEKLIQLREANWGMPGLIVAPTWQMIKGVTVTEFVKAYREWYPEQRPPRLKDPQGECYLEFDEGEIIYVRSAMNPGSIEGFNVAYGGFDEARWAKHAAYRNFVARVRLKQANQLQRVLATTPAMGWLDREYNSGKPRHRLIRAPTRENLRNLAPGYLDDLKASYSPRVQRAILEGQFVPMEGAVFDVFDPAKDSPWFVNFEPNHDTLGDKVYLAIDPGYRESAWVWIARRGKLDWVAFDELMPSNQDTLATVKQVNARGWPVDEIWIDQAANARGQVEGFKVLDAIKHIRGRINERYNQYDRPTIRSVSAERGNQVAFNSIPFGVDKTRVLLGGYQDYPIRLHFSRRLLDLERGGKRGIVRDLAALCYPEAKDGRAIHDMPVDDGVTSHSTDAIRYWAVGMWMTEPRLRETDINLRNPDKVGYRQF